VQNIYYFLQHAELLITQSIPNYNSLEFFVACLTGPSIQFFFCEKNEKFKAAFKVYYILNNITSKINNNYDFFNKTTVGTMLRRRRSCRKKQLRMKLLVRDDEGIIHEASGL
jgi:hypothetical protein